MEREKRWLSLTISFSFLCINLRAGMTYIKSCLPLFGTIYYPTFPSITLQNTTAVVLTTAAVLTDIAAIAGPTISAGFTLPY